MKKCPKPNVRKNSVNTTFAVGMGALGIGFLVLAIEDKLITPFIDKVVNRLLGKDKVVEIIFIPSTMPD